MDPEIRKKSILQKSLMYKSKTVGTNVVSRTGNGQISGKQSYRQSGNDNPETQNPINRQKIIA